MIYYTEEGQDQLSSKKGESVSSTLPLHKIYQTRSVGVVNCCGGEDDGHGHDETVVSSGWKRQWSRWRDLCWKVGRIDDNDYKGCYCVVS